MLGDGSRFIKVVNFNIPLLRLVHESHVWWKHQHRIIVQDDTHLTVERIADPENTDRAIVLDVRHRDVTVWMRQDVFGTKPWEVCHCSMPHEDATHELDRRRRRLGIPGLRYPLLQKFLKRQDR